MPGQQDAEQIIAGLGGVNPFSVSMLQLCQISYDASGIAKAVGQMPPLTPGGGWYCIWGPSSNLIDSNLAFVAGYYPAGASSQLLTCVVLRGTDFDIWDPLGILWQVWEDLDPENPVPVPWPANDPNAMIAGGTADGLDVIRSLTSRGWYLEPYLKAFVGDSLLVVTGHSLGGCLTTVVAPWLQSALSYSGAIIPVTFAAPTAGNPAFAADFNKQFPVALRYWNPLDIVPRAYGDLPAVKDIYVPCGLTIPPEVEWPLDWMEGEIADIPYAQPTPMPALQAKCHKTTSWYDEAAYQHATTTYMELIGGTNIGRLPRTVSRRGNRRMQRAAPRAG